MRKTPFLNRMFLGAAVLTLTLGTVSCKDNKETDTEEIAEDENDMKFDDNEAKEDDSEYLVTAAEVNLKEIELGKLAQQKATNADVKAYAKMLEDNHTKAQNDLKSTADAKSISIPTALTEDGQEAYNNLNDEDVKDFDKKYIDMMVDGHEKTIDKMEKASEKANDPDIRMWAANMLPTLREHLEKAKSLKEMLDK